MTLGDRIVIMKDGFIQQIGTPQEVFDQPANLFVAGFIGSPQMNFFDGELEKKDGKYQLKVGEATVVLGDKAQELLTGKGVGERKVTVGIRPEHIAFAAAPGSDTAVSYTHLLILLLIPSILPAEMLKVAWAIMPSKCSSRIRRKMTPLEDCGGEAKR